MGDTASTPARRVTINRIPYLREGEMAEIMVCVSGVTEGLAVKLTLLNDGDVEFLDAGQNVGQPIETCDGRPRPMHDFFDGMTDRIVNCTNVKEDFVTSEPVRIRARRAAVVRLKVESPNDIFPQEEIQGEPKPQPARWSMATRSLRLVNPQEIPPLLPEVLELPEAPSPVVPVEMDDDDEDFYEGPTPAGVQLRPPSTHLSTLGQDLLGQEPVWTLNTLVPEEEDAEPPAAWEADTDDVEPAEVLQHELPMTLAFPLEELPPPPHLMILPEEAGVEEEALPEAEEEEPPPEVRRPGHEPVEDRISAVRKRKRDNAQNSEKPPKRRWWLFLLSVAVVTLFIFGVIVLAENITYPQATEGVVMNDLMSSKTGVENSIEHPDVPVPPDGSAVAVEEDTGTAEDALSAPEPVPEPVPEDLNGGLLGEEPADPIIAPYVERSCTNPTLLPGGPEADNCFIMGCQEGHGVAWKQVPREDGGLNWATCERYPTESADGTCTQVTNSDGVSTTSKFDTTKNEWLKSHPCSI